MAHSFFLRLKHLFSVFLFFISLRNMSTETLEIVLVKGGHLAYSRRRNEKVEMSLPGTPGDRWWAKMVYVCDFI